MLGDLEHDQPQFRQAGTGGADAMLTFDDRLERACEMVGLPVLAVTGS